jgi:hypothetical protein
MRGIIAVVLTTAVACGGNVEEMDASGMDAGTRLDAGAADASRVDAAAPDAFRTDAAEPTDAGDLDAHVTDAAHTSDGGRADDAGGDGGRALDGSIDAGSLDAGDELMPDAGADAGTPFACVGVVPTFDEFVAQYADVYCAQSLDCPSYYPPHACHPVARDVLFGAYRKALTDGRATFDGAAACACLDAMRDGTCNDRFSIPACKAAFRWSDGGACGEPWALCNPDESCFSTNATLCPIRCTSMPGIGEPCFFGFCADDAVCDSATNMCRARRGSGEPCGDVAVDWRTMEGCDWGLRCHATLRVCIAPGADGEPCGDEDRCQPGLVCLRYSSAESFACRPGPVAGESCATAPANRRACARGHECRSGICQLARLPDGPCTDASDCPSSTWFECDAGTCRPLPVVGEACTTRCAPGTCVDGTCVLSADGQRCYFGWEQSALVPQCASGYCGGTECGTPLGVGTPCASQSDCSTTQPMLDLDCMESTGTCERWCVP